MIKLIAIPKYNSFYGICAQCESVVEYQKEDVKMKEIESGCGSYFHPYILCPNCNNTMIARIDNK